MRLYKGTAEAVGRRSPRSLYRQDLATFGEGMAYDHQDAEGFVRLWGLGVATWSSRQGPGADGGTDAAD